MFDLQPKLFFAGSCKNNLFRKIAIRVQWKALMLRVRRDRYARVILKICA